MKYNMANEVEAQRHIARDALAPVAGLLKGVPGLTAKDQDKRAKAALAAVETAYDALVEAREITKARKKAAKKG